MTSRDDEMLLSQLRATADTVRAFAEQIESGAYGDQWEVENLNTGEKITVTASDGDSAEAAYWDAHPGADVSEHDLWVTPLPADEPIVDQTPISEYPLEIVDERGKEFAVVLTIGGPHIEVVADGGCSARLEGYWGGSRGTLHGDYLSTFLDYFIDRD